MFKNLKFGKKREAEPVEVTDQETGEITYEQTSIADDRNLPSVNKSLSVQTKITQYAIVIGAVVFAGFMLFKYYKGMYEKRKEDTQAVVVDKKQTASVSIPPLDKSQIAASMFDIDPPATPPPAEAAAQTPAAPLPPGMAGTGAQPDGRQYDRNGKPILTEAEIAEARKKSAPVKFKIDGSGPSGYDSTGITRVDDGGTTNREGFAENLKPTYAPGVKATLIPDRNMFITTGTILDCVIDQAIDSNVQGMISCLLAVDARSTNGQVVLMEKGTRLTGEYKGDIKGSDGRLFVLWSRAETPSGVIVALASPGTDALGRAGIGGYVDTHFMDRFSAGILISIIGDASQSLTSTKDVSGNQNTVSYPATTSAATSLATEAIKQNGNIANTLKRNQAANIRVFVARDLDFRGVYGLEYKK